MHTQVYSQNIHTHLSNSEGMKKLFNIKDKNPDNIIFVPAIETWYLVSFTFSNVQNSTDILNLVWAWLHSKPDWLEVKGSVWQNRFLKNAIGERTDETMK